MNTLDRYILGEWLKILGLVLTATIGLLLLQVMYDDFRDLREWGAGVGDIAVYFGVHIPRYLTVVLQVALLISLLYALGQLHRSNEFTAMRAAGLSIFRLTRSVWLAGFVCCGLTWILNSQVVPWSVEQSRRVLESLKYRHQARTDGVMRAGLISSVAFDNRREGRLWFINRYSRLAERAFGVTISILDGQRRETGRIVAREASFDPATRAWTLRDGRELSFDPGTGDVGQPVVFTERTFADFHEDPQLMLLIDRDAGDLSFHELRRLIDYFEAERSPKLTPYAVRYHALIADVVGCLIVVGIAVPFAVSGVRVSPVVGVSKSIGLFFAYYLLVNLASTLGGREILTPAAAAWMPNLAMAGVAAWLFGRMR